MGNAGYSGSYEYVKQWYRYTRGVSTVQDFVAAVNTPVEDPEANAGREELRQMLVQLTQETGLEQGMELFGSFADQMAPKIAMVRLNPTPTDAMIEAYREY